jgi:hypothetical protein
MLPENTLKNSRRSFMKLVAAAPLGYHLLVGLQTMTKLPRSGLLANMMIEAESVNRAHDGSVESDLGVVWMKFPTALVQIGYRNAEIARRR